MVQLKIHSGRPSGPFLHVVREFPCVIGRSPLANLRMEENGIWDRHIEICLSSSGRFVLRTFPDAWATLNGRRFEEAGLRNGDVIELGLSKIQFWLSEARQKSLLVRECLTWLSLGLLCVGQVGLVYWLLRS